MTTASWNGNVFATSTEVILVEFAVYVPFASIRSGVLKPSSAEETYCHWKGHATYYDVIIDGQINEAAAWTYKAIYPEAASIAGHLAFWKGIEVKGKPVTEPLKDPGGPIGQRKGYEALAWLLVQGSESLGREEIEHHTSLQGQSLIDAFSNPHLAPYRKRYQWQLVDGALSKS